MKAAQVVEALARAMTFRDGGAPMVVSEWLLRIGKSFGGEQRPALLVPVGEAPCRLPTG